MFDLINGLPIHPLVVHAIVVLLPLAVVGTIAIVARPSWRRPYGPLVVAATAISVVLLPVATSSGEALEKHVGDPGEHADLGESLIWFAIPLLLLALAVVVLDRRAAAASPDAAAAGTSPGGSSTPHKVVAALAVLVALGTAVQVYRVGDSGARAAWGDQVTSSSGGDHPDGDEH